MYIKKQPSMAPCLLALVAAVYGILTTRAEAAADAARADSAADERGLFWDVAPYAADVNPLTVTAIHIVFSNHLDIGFNSRAWCDGGAYEGCISPEATVDGMPCRPWAYRVLQEVSYRDVTLPAPLTSPSSPSSSSSEGSLPSIDAGSLSDPPPHINLTSPQKKASSHPLRGRARAHA